MKKKKHVKKERLCKRVGQWTRKYWNRLESFQAGNGNPRNIRGANKSTVRKKRTGKTITRTKTSSSDSILSRGEVRSCQDSRKATWRILQFRIQELPRTAREFYVSIFLLHEGKMKHEQIERGEASIDFLRLRRSRRSRVHRRGGRTAVSNHRQLGNNQALQTSR